MSAALPIGRGLAAHALLLFLWQRRRTLWASIRHEFANRYSGSLFGLIWIVLFPLLFLSIYVFVYTLVFRVRLPGGDALDYVVYVFCGLVPYLSMMEAANQAAVSVRGNLSAVRSALLPIEIIPARVAGVAMVSLLVGLIVVIALSIASEHLSRHIVLLPLVLVSNMALLLGMACILAVFGALLRDVAYIVNLFSLILLFLSPIAYTKDMLPSGLWFLRDANPVGYLVGAYRIALFDKGPVDWAVLVVFAVMSVLVFVAGAMTLRRFKGIATDHA